MSTFHTVVAAVDFSQTSYDALRLAADLARESGSRLHVLHVVTDPWQQPALVEVPGTPFEELRRQCVVAAEDQLRKMQNACAEHVEDVTLRVLMGSPAFEIARYAREQGADLIVVGTHGHGPVRRFLLGSVADRMLRQATCPVLTVPHQALRDALPGEEITSAPADSARP